MKIWVIANPASGTAPEPEALQQKLHERLPSAELYITDETRSASDLAREALRAGCKLVVAAGGDGTINQVVNGMGSDFSLARLGILPLGTGNDFARSIGVPTDLDGALDVLHAGQARSLDLVQVESDQTRYFINVSAGGFSGLVNEKLTEEMKRTWGPLAYLRSALAALPDLSHYYTKICFDDEPPLTVVIYNLVVANARFVAGGIPIAPEASLDDGLLDVLAVPAASLTQLAVLVPQILLGQHLTSELVIFRRVRRLQIDSHPGMWFNVDGELVGNEPATFTALPRAIEVVVGELAL